MHAMRIAFVARPQWEDALPGLPASSRLVDAPLQQLKLCQPASDALQAIGRASHPWVVFTSPASVEAMDQWALATGIHPMQIETLRIAAVGGGTRNAIADMAMRHGDDAAAAWPVAVQDIVVSASDERADAATLLDALDRLQRSEGFVWKNQTFLLAQGANNRPTLADGLAQRGSDVIAIAMYQRCDVPWSERIWQAIRTSSAGECGVVVTSSTVIARLMADLAAHGVSIPTLVWCTHHAAIAERLKSAGVSMVRRVSLDPSKLEKDLYEHEQYW